MAIAAIEHIDVDAEGVLRIAGVANESFPTS